MNTSDEGESLYIDFLALAIQDEAFGKIYQRNGGAVNFKNPEDIQQLTKSILKRRFNLTIELPDDRLCPPVPIRYEYVRWLQTLIDTTSDAYTETYDPARRIIGIDMYISPSSSPPPSPETDHNPHSGTGASAIYPLLACSQRTSWRFMATELDAASHASAERNITANNLAPRIRLRRAPASGPLLPLADLPAGMCAAFVMCNPPFFSSAEDMAATNLTKAKPPSAVCTGAPVEMVCPGGDLGFARRMLAESVRARRSVQWYTIMLGKLSSATSLVGEIKAAGVSNWAVTALQAGHKTKRWVVGWSFGGLRPRNDVARGTGVAKELLPFPTEFVIHGIVAFEGEVRRKVDEVLGPLDLSWEWAEAGEVKQVSGVCVSKTNVWSRAARRKRGGSSTKLESKSTGGDDSSDEDSDDIKDSVFAARITLAQTQGDIRIRWLRGHDVVVWESFCGMLKREVVKALGA